MLFRCLPLAVKGTSCTLYNIRGDTQSSETHFSYALSQRESCFLFEIEEEEEEEKMTTRKTDALARNNVICVA